MKDDAPVLKYAVGVQNFSEIISGGYLYVNKTAYIKQLISRMRKSNKVLLFCFYFALGISLAGCASKPHSAGSRNQSHPLLISWENLYESVEYGEPDRYWSRDGLKKPSTSQFRNDFRLVILDKYVKPKDYGKYYLKVEIPDWTWRNIKGTERKGNPLLYHESEPTQSTDTNKDTLSRNPFPPIETLKFGIEEYQRQFSVSLFKNLVNQKFPDRENVAFSPFSLYTLLTLLINGSDSIKTKHLIASMAGDYPLAQINNYVRNIINWSKRDNEDIIFQVNNSLWFDPTIKLRESYATGISKIAELSAHAVNPNGNAGMDSINKWACLSTSGLISNLLCEPLFGNNAVAMNALALKALWAPDRGRIKRPSEKLDFHNLDGTEIRTDFFKKTWNGIYGKANGMEYACVPLIDSGFSIVLYLPEEPVNLTELIGVFNENSLKRYPFKEEPSELYITLPKFKYSSLNEFENYIKDICGNEGLRVENIFSSTGITIEKILQPVMIGVDEDGIEAASVSMGILLGASGKPDYKKVNLVFDRPFFYTIEDTESGTIYFMGAVAYL